MAIKLHGVKKNPPSTASQLTALLLFAVLGTFLILHKPYPDAKIAKEDCTFIETEFLSYEEDWYKSGLRYIFINCTNSKQYYIKWTAQDKLRSGVAALPERANISLLLYPGSNEIVSFATENETLLSLDDMLHFMHKRNVANRSLGIIVYGIVLWGAINLIPLVQQKKSKQ